LDAVHMNMCWMINEKSLTPKHTNAFLLVVGNNMVLKATICMIKPHADSLWSGMVFLMMFCFLLNLQKKFKPRHHHTFMCMMFPRNGLSLYHFNMLLLIYLQTLLFYPPCQYHPIPQTPSPFMEPFLPPHS
jgi:hypothetical protein